MKVIIAGGRDFKEYLLLKLKCDKILKGVESVEIVSGNYETGADPLGIKYAKERGYPVRKFDADWDADDKAAGPIRNRKMAQYADSLIAFWNGRSPGTANMIKLAEEFNLPTRIIKYR